MVEGTGSLRRPSVEYALTPPTNTSSPEARSLAASASAPSREK